ncbi:MAG: hypothetical protein LBI74_05365 [Synergistaceae bacterium]|nr:hypothetical protein [Synergistaceae bacterium]
MLVCDIPAERYSNPHSDYNIDREVNLAVSWLESVMRRSLRLAENFKIRTFANRSDLIRVQWLTSVRDEVWRADHIYFQSQNRDKEVTFNYSFQTMSPAFTLVVYIKEESKFVDTGRRIVVSVYGLIRTE